MWVQFLGWKDPLDEGTATHSSITAWRIPWTEEPGGLQFIGSQKVGHDWAHTLIFLSVRFVVPQNNYNNNIRDHWSQITITNITIMKSLKHGEKYVTQRHTVNKRCGKKMRIDLLNVQYSVTIKLQLVKTTTTTTTKNNRKSQYRHISEIWKAQFQTLQ